VTRHLDDQVIVLNRTGSPGLLTALNFDTWNARPITCQTSFGPNVQLHDYTGTHHDIWTDAQGNASFTIPSNAHSRGQSYLCFSRSGLDAPNRVTARSTTQTIFGAPDLDVLPAESTQRLAGAITAELDTDVTIAVRPNRRNWAADSALHVVVSDPKRHVVLEQICTSATTTGRGRTRISGEHAIHVTGQGLPEAGSAFEIEVSYTAPQAV
jgi:alpha-amylase